MVYYSKTRIFAIGHECNDRGWVYDDHYFKDADIALQYMRDLVAKEIRRYRKEGHKVDYFVVFKDTVTWDVEDNHPSQTINFRVNNGDLRYENHEVLGYDDYKYYEYRLFALPLYEKKYM